MWWHRRQLSAIVLDVGGAGIRVCQLVREGRTIRLVDALSVDMTRPSQDRAREDSSTASPSKSREQTSGTASPDDADAARLARLTRQGQFRGDAAALVVSAPLLRFHALELPAGALKQEPSRIREAIRFELGQSNADQQGCEIDYWRLRASGRGGVNTAAVTVPSDQVRRWVSAFENEGLELRRVEASPCALVRAAQCAWRPQEQCLWGVVDLGASHVTVTVVVGRQPAYVRTIGVQLGGWPRLLMEALGVDEIRAQDLLWNHGLSPGDGNDRFGRVLRERLLPEVSRLAREVTRCFAYARQHVSGAEVSRVLLAGRGAQVQGLPALLEHELGASVHTLDLTDVAPTLHVGYSAAAGAALLQLGEAA